MEKEICNTVVFEDIIKNKGIYVDKTEYVAKLVRIPEGAYIISRPPGFGKTLFISILKLFFQGNRKAFEGLDIYDKIKHWQKYPIIHFDFSDCIELNLYQKRIEQRIKELKDYLLKKVLGKAEELSINLRNITDPSEGLRTLINDIPSKKQIVIFVDGYDVPLLSNILGSNANRIIEIMKSFYSVLYKTEREKRFVFMAGTSTCFRSTLFSEWKNLIDITRNPDYATMFGYKQKEIEMFFSEYIDLSIKTTNMPQSFFMQEIKKWYAGYKFEPNSEDVYSPISLNSFFDKINQGLAKMAFNYYNRDAFLSSFLAKYLTQVSKRFSIPSKIEPIPISAFDNFDFKPDNLIAMYQQAGCFAIISSNIKNDEMYFQIKINNKEMRDRIKWVNTIRESSAYFRVIPQIEKGIDSICLIKLIKPLKNDDK